MALKLGTKVIIAIAFASAVCTVASVFIAHDQIESLGEQALVEKSRAILSRLEVARSYVAKMGVLERQIQEAVATYPDGDLPKERRETVLKAVPIVASIQLGVAGAAQENYQFRIFSENPRNEKNAPSAFERALLQRFKNDPKLSEIIERSEDGKYQLVVRPVRLSEGEGCLKCHGHPSTSPWGNGKDILGHEMENMKHGDLKGAFAIVSSLEPVRSQTASTTLHLVLWGLGLMGVAQIVAFCMIKGPLKILDGVVNQLSNDAQNLVSSSGEIATSSSELRNVMTTQASALHQTLVAVDQISSTVTHNAETAERSKEFSARNKQSIENGKSVVHEMIDSIEAINRSNGDIVVQIEKSKSEIGEITRVISEIGEKTKVINDIVFQTKLLSFNASVEAARAGEHGKGFAVVAEEIGNLAQMSGSAATQINSMLDASIEKVESIIRHSREQIDGLVQAGSERVKAGTVKAQKCGEVLDQIMIDSDTVNSMIENIAVASKQQAQGITEIQSAVSQLDQVTNQTTQVTEQTTESGEKVHKQADEMKAIALQLKDVVRGSEAA